MKRRRNADKKLQDLKRAARGGDEQANLAILSWYTRIGRRCALPATATTLPCTRRVEERDPYAYCPNCENAYCIQHHDANTPCVVCRTAAGSLEAATLLALWQQALQRCAFQGCMAVVDDDIQNCALHHFCGIHTYMSMPCMECGNPGCCLTPPTQPEACYDDACGGDDGNSWLCRNHINRCDLCTEQAGMYPSGAHAVPSNSFCSQHIAKCHACDRNICNVPNKGNFRLGKTKEAINMHRFWCGHCMQPTCPDCARICKSGKHMVGCDTPCAKDKANNKANKDCKDCERVAKYKKKCKKHNPGKRRGRKTKKA